MKITTIYSHRKEAVLPCKASFRSNSLLYVAKYSVILLRKTKKKPRISDDDDMVLDDAFRENLSDTNLAGRDIHISERYSESHKSGFKSWVSV